MYELTGQQIGYILEDIRSRGIQTEDLQQNLLDHICCIIEAEMGDDDNFELFYRSRIAAFYRRDLSEIEEETQLLLTFQNYYAMKKVMMMSGIASAGLMCSGLAFKFLHLPGAAAILFAGISITVLIFLPLMLILKMREKQELRDKAVIAVGSLSAILLCCGVLFKMQHWPMANMLITASLAVLAFLFLPVYFFTGYRNPATRVNTIVSSVLIILGCALLLMLVMTPRTVNHQRVADTKLYLNSEAIVQREKRLTAFDASNPEVKESSAIIAICDEIKAYIVKTETGAETIPADFETSGTLIRNGWIDFDDHSGISEKFRSLRGKISDYNERFADGRNGMQPVEVTTAIIETRGRSMMLLNELTQIQMQVLQNAHELQLARL